MVFGDRCERSDACVPRSLCCVGGRARSARSLPVPRLWGLLDLDRSQAPGISDGSMSEERRQPMVRSQV